jgi:DNA-binding CsgD family transcriptional regulator
MVLARDIFKILADKKTDPHLEYLAECNKNLGVAYTQLQRFEEAEQQFIAALEIEMLQAESNPYVYEPRVAECYIEFGNLYLRAKRYAEAKEKYDAALTYYKRLSGRTPDAFEPELAKCYYFIGELYNETKRYSEASEALTTAIRLYEKYRETNPVFAERIADARKILDGVIASQRRQEGAFEQFTKEEKEVALLLTEGKSRTEIINKLRLSAFELSSIIRCIREKISMQGDSSPVIDAVAEEYKLTKREADMLSYLSRNAGNELIASELFLSEETVRIHVRNVIKKLSIENRKSVSVWLDKYSKSM